MATQIAATMAWFIGFSLFLLGGWWSIPVTAVTVVALGWSAGSYNARHPES